MMSYSSSESKRLPPEKRAQLLSAVDRNGANLTVWLRKTDITKSNDWTAMAFMESAAAEMKAMESITLPENWTRA